MILRHMKEIPSIGQVLVVFDQVLAKHNLASPSTDVNGAVSVEAHPESAGKAGHDPAWHGGFPAMGWLNLLELDDPMLGDLSIFESTCS